jgi:hypothetical protein
MENQISARSDFLREQAGYFSVPGAHLYTVLHHVPNPLARVLLVGPFASERQFAYYAWVRWARYLAARRIEVLRFDYRGIGESTATFEDVSFNTWDQDLDLLAGWFAAQSPDVPLLLHGMECGAILAGRSFVRGTGHALLLWAPPTNANQALRSILRRWAGLEQFYESPQNRRSASQYIREIEEGSPIEVYSYQWTNRLWCDSFHFELPAGLEVQDSCGTFNARPYKVVTFGTHPASLVMPYKRYDEGQDLGWLYSSTHDWLCSTLAHFSRGSDEAHN